MQVNKEAIDTFERHEKKYMLHAAQYEALAELLQARMQGDEYGRYTNCSLYYDTGDFAVIRRNLEKPIFKTKLRLRSYGVPQAGTTVFLELKKKLQGVTYKRRISLSHQEAVWYMHYGRPPAETGQIFEEIDWFRRQQPLLGQVVLCYDRIALSGRDDPGLRVTIDANLRWRNYSLELSRGDHGTLLLPRGTRLMEIKTRNSLPLWLAEALSSLEIYPRSFSKYGTVYQTHLAGKEGLRHVG